MSANDDRQHETEQASPGAVLAAGREAEKLSLAEVARHLKLSVAQVEALESGDFDRLPGPVFVRGFVRNYARLVKVDPDALLRDVEPELAPLSRSPETPPSRDIPFPPRARSRWPWFALLLLLAIGGLAVYEFYWSEPLPDSTAIAPTPLNAPPAVASAPPAAMPSLPDSADTGVPIPSPAETAATTAVEKAPAIAPKPAAAKVPTVAGTPGVSRAPGAPATPIPAATDKAAAPGALPAPMPQAQESPVPAGAGVVLLEFDDESWVEILDRGGNIVFSQLNPAGTRKRVIGEPPLSLVIGNAHGVRVLYNDRPVDLKAHTKVDVARFVLE